MNAKLQKYIRDKQLFTKKDRLLLAVSGGVDSVVLAHLIKEAGFAFAIAHVNFKLRGKASDGDAAFVKKLAHQFKVPLFTVSFDTKTFAKKHKQSIQMAARQLRYAYFESLVISHRFDAILTAHHQDDAIETFLLNLTRGTGLAGLQGIPVKNSNVCRPLLFASRKEIEDYAAKHRILFRKDASNDEDTYKRNKIRLKVMPILKELNPSVDKAFMHAMENIAVAADIQNRYIEQRLSRITTVIKNRCSLSIDALTNEAHPTLLMHHLLKPYGFSNTAADEIMRALQSNGKKTVRSATHELIKDRTFLFLQAIQHDKPTKIILQAKTKSVNYGGWGFHFEYLKGGLQQHLEASKNAGLNQVYLDADALIFPLTLRPWKAGDALIPLGMKGRKKVSDIITDAKLTTAQKDRLLVLESEGKIAWLVGLRSDDRFKMKGTTKKVVRVSVEYLANY